LAGLFSGARMKIGFGVAALAALAAFVVSLPADASAQSLRSEVTASNGVVVTVDSDEFANRYEYSAPQVAIDDGFVLVSRLIRADTIGPVYIGGGFIYSGDWRFYDSALFRGGDPAEFISAGRDVGRCSSSRYGRPSCTLTEAFLIKLTPKDVATRGVDGKVALQIRSGRTMATVLLEVPTSHFDAVMEVSARPRP